MNAPYGLYLTIIEHIIQEKSFMMCSFLIMVLSKVLFVHDIKASRNSRCLCSFINELCYLLFNPKRKHYSTRTVRFCH